MAVENLGLFINKYETTPAGTTVSLGTTTRAIEPGEIVFIVMASKGGVNMTGVSTFGSVSTPNSKFTTVTTNSNTAADLIISYWQANERVASGSSVSITNNTSGVFCAILGFTVSGGDVRQGLTFAHKLSGASTNCFVSITVPVAGSGLIAFLNYRQDFGTAGETFPTNCIRTPFTVNDQYGYIIQNTTAVMQLEVMGESTTTAATKNAGGNGTLSTSAVAVTAVAIPPFAAPSNTVVLV